MNKPSPHTPDIEELPASCPYDDATLQKLATSRTLCFCPACERRFDLETMEPRE